MEVVSQNYVHYFPFSAFTVTIVYPDIIHVLRYFCSGQKDDRNIINLQLRVTSVVLLKSSCGLPALCENQKLHVCGFQNILIVCVPLFFPAPSFTVGLILCGIGLSLLFVSLNTPVCYCQKSQTWIHY